MGGMLTHTSSTNLAHDVSHVRTARQFGPMTIKRVVVAFLVPHISHGVIFIGAVRC
jgi:hypothetical protein